MKGAHRFHPTILREYDVRGIVGETLGPEDAWALGRAFGSVIAEAGGRSVAVGYDGRLASPALEGALVRGLLECGLEVWRVGLGPTPMLYYATHELAADGGVMVTGSHNPPAHNGFKMVLGRRPFFGADIARLGRIAAAGDYTDANEGRVRERPVLDRYVERLAADYRGADAKHGRLLKVAWDAGNGAAGDAMARLTRMLPGRHVLLNEVIDGRFPAHHPDPTVAKNLEQLQTAVAREGCEVGFAFDGDGDRLGVVDGDGEVVWSDQLMVVLAREVLARRPGATIVADVKSSRVLFEEIARAGGVPLMWRTGHSLIKAKMAELGAPLAGELAGHIFFADGYYGFDDALYAAVRLLRILSRSSESLADMRRSLPATATTPELRFDCPDERKFAVIEEVKARLERAGTSPIAIDGVRLETADGWWLIRASNTQAALVVRCEGNDADGLRRLMDAVAGQLRQSGLTPPAGL